jgi:hypothetical protein
MTVRRFTTLLAASGVALAAPALAQSASDVSDLVGARAAGGETQMESRGYRNVRASRVRDTSYTFWWNPERRQCVSVATSDGRYVALDAVPAGNCGPAPLELDSPAAVSGDLPSETLVLICYGEGRRPTVRNAPRYQWNRDEHRYEWSSELVSGTQGFNADVQVEIYGDHGRIHLTGPLVPPIHSGDSDGWWDIADLRLTPDRITGRYRLNGLNKPKLDIDRRSGRVFIDGIEDFRGTCDAGNWGGGRRF